MVRWHLVSPKRQVLYRAGMIWGEGEKYGLIVNAESSKDCSA